jgi:hypothetical protein
MSAKKKKASLLEEVRAGGSLPVWRRDDDSGPMALRITKTGLAAKSCAKRDLLIFAKYPRFCAGARVSARKKDCSEAVWGLPSLAAENRFLERGKGAAAVQTLVAAAIRGATDFN